MVEGVQQLGVSFGQSLPQLAVAALTPFLIFAYVAALDLPIALVLLGATIVTLLAPALWHRTDSQASLARSKAYSAFAAEFLDSIQGLRSEEHTSELQSLAYLVCRLLLEKKKKNKNIAQNTTSR